MRGGFTLLVQAYASKRSKKKGNFKTLCRNTKCDNKDKKQS